MQRVDNYDQARLLAIKSSQKDAASVHLAKITGLKLIRVTSWIVVMLQQCCNSTCVAGRLAGLLPPSSEILKENVSFSERDSFGALCILHFGADDGQKLSTMSEEVPREKEGGQRRRGA